MDRKWILAKLVVILTVSLLVSLSFQQDSDEDESYKCSSLSRDNNTCEGCIAHGPNCAWCAQAEVDANKPRCDLARNLQKYCSAHEIKNPKSGKELARDRELSEPKARGRQPAPLHEMVQIRPQRVKVRLRPNDDVTVPVKFRQVRDYPVDLYYLMDLSQSMKDDKDKLATLGELLARRMRNITSDFRLGFGSFVDKKLMPWVDPRPEKQNRPCDECVPPYGFKHHMTMSTDASNFQTQVREARISGNLDAPEAGFDAIVQALECKEEIGWRDKSRRMLVLSTDAGFHYAGDGRLAGLVIPNDGQCHLTNGMYDMSEKQDYPSISQIHKTARKHQANLIFAVTKKWTDLYERLQDSLPDVSSAVGVLADDSRNIVELIVDQYNKIAQKIIMVDDKKPGDLLTITYSSACKGNIPLDQNTCDGIKIGDTVTFNVTLRADGCRPTGDNHYEIRVGPSGLQDSVIFDVDVICECDCDDVERRSPKCNGDGDYRCGVCKCRTMSGPTCECRPGETTAEMELGCKKGKDPDALVCEGRGRCDCGKCVCDNPERVSGEFCECDDTSCARWNREVCAGHGECRCGDCVCQPGWTGRACECTTKVDNCVSNGKICSGKGDCVCGKCVCRDDRYSGPFCDVCATCPTKCDEYRPCVMCKTHKTGPYNGTQCEDPLKCPFDQYIEVDELPNINGTTKCQFVDPHDDCTFYFLYMIDEDLQNVTVWAKRDKKCPPPVPVLAIVLGVIAGIVLIGLILLLLWKLLTVLHDRREYARFEKERLMAKWDTGENPIFHPATTTFKNPAYGGRG